MRPLVPHPTVLVLALLAGCGGHEPNRGALDERSTRVAVAAPAFDPAQPFDPRLARLRPEAHVGQERLCDVVFVGASTPITHRIENRYADRFTSRNMIRCGALSGESWADLVFSEAARAFVGVVAPGMRLKVRVLAPDGGFENATVLEFLAVLEGATGVTPPRDSATSVSAGFDFRRVREDPRLVGQRRVCSVAYVGPIRRVTREDADLYPRGASHHVSVVCHHAVGDAWVEVLASSRSAYSTLELERGRRITLEIRSQGGGPADHPFVLLAPQLGAASPRAS